MFEVVQPATQSAPAGTVLRYGYDDANRLQSMTDAKGQTWLVVRYDDAGRGAAMTAAVVLLDDLIANECDSNLRFIRARDVLLGLPDPFPGGGPF